MNKPSLVFRLAFQLESSNTIGKDTDLSADKCAFKTVNYEI